VAPREKPPAAGMRICLQVPDRYYVSGRAIA
jgi:hypothetical protein